MKSKILIEITGLITACMLLCSCTLIKPVFERTASSDIAPASDGGYTEQTNEYKPQTESESHHVNQPKADSDSETVPLPGGNEADNDCVGIMIDNFRNADASVSFGYHDYSSDYSYKSDNSKMKSASVIKLFIMEYAFDCITKGTLTSDHMIGTRKLSSLIESMITVSDNDATNILIDEFGMDEINSFITSSGYTCTTVGRRMLDFKAQAEGRENYTCVSDVMKFLDNIYTHKDKAPYCDMLEIMKRQAVNTKIRRDLPPGAVIANKTGELSDVENDVGIIFSTGGDFAFVVLSNDVKFPENMRDTIAKTALDVYNQTNSIK